MNLNLKIPDGRHYSEPVSFQHLFRLGMKRDLPELLAFDGPSFHCGASGKYVAPGAVPLGPPQWIVPMDPIPAADDSVATVHAYHFLEHLAGDDAVKFLREVERVLIPGRSVFNFSVPYFNTVLMAQSLEHKSWWCEETFPKLFHEDTFRYYGEWRLRVHFQVIMGIVNRNVGLLGQLVKD